MNEDQELTVGLPIGVRMVPKDYISLLRLVCLISSIVTMAKRYHKFPRACGYGPFVVPSRCPWLVWRSLIVAVSF